MSMEYDTLEGEAFDEVNNLLDDGNSQTDVLILKNNELQKIVQTLTRTNERLISRIEEIQDQLDREREERKHLEDKDAPEFNQEYSLLEGGFGETELMIREYKRELEAYKALVSAQMTEKDRMVEELQDRYEEVLMDSDNWKHQVTDLQSQNDMLLSTKDNLLSEIDELESSLRRSKHEATKYNSRHLDFNMDISSRYDGDFSGEFGMSVQYELEKLIDKLVKELEHERFSKKKLVEEIKQLRKDVLDQEKIINQKNQKIYQLEITAIKGSKQREKTRSRAPLQERTGSRDVQETPSDRAWLSRRKNFTMMELMNECIILSSKQKLIISLKLIDLYSRKYQNSDYDSEILESILVTNYNPNNAHLCQIKINPAVQKDHDSENDSEQQLVWNLVFILDSLLSQMGGGEVGSSENEQTLLEAIGFFLENKDENSIDSVMELRKIVEEALNDHLR